MARRHTRVLSTYVFIICSKSNHRAVGSRSEPRSQPGRGRRPAIQIEIEIERTIKRKEKNTSEKKQGRRGSRKKGESLQYLLYHHDQALPRRPGNFRKYRGNPFFIIITVELLLAADRTDGSRWAAAVNQPSPEADERASWIGREGLGAHNFNQIALAYQYALVGCLGLWYYRKNPR